MEKKNLMNTEEENKFIAWFMGGKLEDNGWNFCLSDFGTNVIGGYGFYESFDLKFHKSWDWLMAVVDKIENDKDKFYSVTIEYNSCMIDTVFGHRQFIGINKLEAVYNAVVEFIKWYNKNNINNEIFY